MKIHLAQIPEEGLDCDVRIELATLERLREAIGEQHGALRAQVRIKNREGNVEIAGTLDVELQPPCQRCLEPVPLRIAEPVRVALAPSRTYATGPDDVQLGQGELELSFYEGEELDLRLILEDELLLLLPEAVAEEDEDGRCTVCGRLVDELFANGQEAGGAHPFAALKRMINAD
jgi:uncharacterized protein